MKVTIIIPTFNGRENLEKCIKKLDQYLEDMIVVDNASTDKTISYLKTNFPDIKLIELSKNYGFTKAVNEGVKAAKSEYILILNNDCIIDEEDIERLQDFAIENKLVATQPIVLKKDNIENIGFVVDLKKGKATPVTDANEISNTLSNNQIWEKGTAYGLSATCLLMKRDIFLQEGELDERFHSYLEDVDLFIRFAKKGYKFAPCLDVTVLHEHMATSSKMGFYKEWHDFTNWIRIIIKNYPLNFIIKNFTSLLVERLRNASGLIKKIVTIYT